MLGSKDRASNPPCGSLKGTSHNLQIHVVTNGNPMTFQMVILVPAPTCTTPPESGSVGKASFLIALGDAVALRHAKTMPMQKTIQEAAAFGRRLLCGL